LKVILEVSKKVHLETIRPDLIVWSVISKEHIHFDQLGFALSFNRYSKAIL